MAEQCVNCAGWIPDRPDHRDHTPETERIPERLKTLKQDRSVKDMIEEIGLGGARAPTLPPKHDLLRWCPPIEDQGQLGSCTAHAGVSLVEYFERRAFGHHIDASRLFLYKATRNLLHWVGDRGAFLRTTMGAMVLFGVPPEEYCTYDIANFDNEPGAFCYAYAQNYQAMTYYRLDPPSVGQNALLDRVKLFLFAGLPPMFGFTVYSSYTQANRPETKGQIPFPNRGEAAVGGHAVVAVGYDDNLKIKNLPDGPETKGALLIRNSWGRDWGKEGYGWLPYEYVKSGLARDWWSLLKNQWVDTKQFGISPNS